ncbi:hypothetical protein Droror1_Dr00005816 [Drosera rotundifolia]
MNLSIEHGLAATVSAAVVAGVAVNQTLDRFPVLGLRLCRLPPHVPTLNFNFRISNARVADVRLPRATIDDERRWPAMVDGWRWSEEVDDDRRRGGASNQ